MGLGEDLSESQLERIHELQYEIAKRDQEINQQKNLMETYEKLVQAQNQEIDRQKNLMETYEKLVQAQDDSIAYLKGFIAKLGYGKVE